MRKLIMMLVLACAAPVAAGPPRALPTTAPRAVVVIEGAERRYTGEPISLSLKDADVRNVLANFARLTGLNVVVDPAVRGSVTVELRDVPWDQALDVILRLNRLGYELEGTILYVAPLEVLARPR